MLDQSMEKIDFRARMDALVAKARDNEIEAQQQHAARMAKLPPGTCERCYGERRIPHKYTPNGKLIDPCPECDPPILHAPGVPVEFHSARFDSYRVEDGNKTGVDKGRAFIKGTRDLFLTGGVGAGKTRLACTIANEAYHARMGARFVRVPMVLHQLQPGRSPDDIAELERQLFTAPILVLDDIGAERDMATDYTRRTLLMIYEERGDRGHRTIFTSNKTVGELAAMQDDDRLASRIAGRADVVKLSTPDQRMLRRVK